jgi:hypothetical protein
MEIELTYRYSELDQRKEFGLIFITDKNYYETYIRWVYYYLGVYLGERKFPLFQFSLMNHYLKGVKTKKYKYCNNAKLQAKIITNAINKYLKK